MRARRSLTRQDPDQTGRRTVPGSQVRPDRSWKRRPRGWPSTCRPAERYRRRCYPRSHRFRRYRSNRPRHSRTRCSSCPWPRRFPRCRHHLTARSSCPAPVRRSIRRSPARPCPADPGRTHRRSVAGYSFRPRRRTGWSRYRSSPVRPGSDADRSLRRIRTRRTLVGSRSGSSRRRSSGRHRPPPSRPLAPSPLRRPTPAAIDSSRPRLQPPRGQSLPSASLDQPPARSRRWRRSSAWSP